MKVGITKLTFCSYVTFIASIIVYIQAHGSEAYINSTGFRGGGGGGGGIG